MSISVSKIEEIMRDTVTEIMPDCIFTAEHVVDRRAMQYIEEKEDTNYLKSLIKHHMANGIAALVEGKLRASKREDYDGVHFKARIVVMTENEIKSMITIAANKIAEEEWKSGRKR